MDHSSIQALGLDFDLIQARLPEASPGERAILYARLFWPTFVEFEGMVFLEGTVEDDGDVQRLRAATARFRDERARIEESFNFHELDLLFGGLQGTSEGEDEWLAERLATMWRARLRDLFPDRSFVVKVVRPDQSEGHELGVVFHSA